MSKKYIAICVIGLVAVISFGVLSTQSDGEKWKTFRDPAIGIEFEIPEYLHAFPSPPDGIVFSEYDGGMGMIHIMAQPTERTDTEAVVREEISSFPQEKITGTRTIDGVNGVVVTNSSGTEDALVLYFIHKNVLYTVNARHGYVEHLWDTIRLK